MTRLDRWEKVVFSKTKTLPITQDLVGVGFGFPDGSFKVSAVPRPKRNPPLYCTYDS